MSIQYIMNKDKWISEVIQLLPDTFKKSIHGTKEDIAFDLSLEYGIISGLIPNGWYPAEALYIFVNLELNKGNIEESDLQEFYDKVADYGTERILIS
jgi:hypothetical protein